MGDSLIQVRDPTRLHCLVMPPPRVAGASHALPATSHGFPWAIPPTHAGAVPETGLVGHVFHGAVGLRKESHHQQQQSPQQHPPHSQYGYRERMDDDQTSGFGVVVPGWTTPAGYVVCGLSMGLCNLVAPAYITACCHVLSPVWTLAVALHIVANPGQQDIAWVWGGVLTVLLLPFVVLIGSQLFVGFYLFVFALFSSSGLFWRRLHGTSFILAWVCWGGLFLSSGLGLGVGIPPQMHLCVAAFFSIALGVLNSGGGKFAMRGTSDV